MKIFLFSGSIFVALGIASLIAPIHHTEKYGIKAEDVSFRIQTTHSERCRQLLVSC
jgi:hypothetical protein